jgi:hypothetical protein
MCRYKYIYRLKKHIHTYGCYLFHTYVLNRERRKIQFQQTNNTTQNNKINNHTVKKRNVLNSFKTKRPPGNEICTYIEISSIQGDQIGWIFDTWTIFIFMQILTSLWGNIFLLKPLRYWIWQDMVLATFWAIFHKSIRSPWLHTKGRANGTCAKWRRFGGAT